MATAGVVLHVDAKEVEFDWKFLENFGFDHNQQVYLNLYDTGIRAHSADGYISMSDGS